MFNPETMAIEEKVLAGSQDAVGLWDDSAVYKVLLRKMKDIQDTCLDE